jgi:hypothetical protein
MSHLLWPFGVYFGIGVVWLAVVKVMARSQYEYVSPKEAAIHILAWPFVLVEVKLWWVAIAAVAVVGAAAFTVIDRPARSIAVVPQPVHLSAL